MAPKLLIKVDPLQKIYIGEAEFSREKSGQNAQHYIHEVDTNCLARVIKAR